MADGELLDVYDELGAHLGVERRDVVHRDGLWHRGFHLWVVSGGAVLLQRRSATKDTHPGQLDATAAGHVGAGETILEGGAREVAEELGVRYPAARLVPIGVRSSVDRVGAGGRMLNREFQHVYVVSDPRPLAGWDALDHTELDGLVAMRLEHFGALAAGAAPGPWPARTWDGERESRSEIARAEVVPASYLAELGVALRRFARGERPLAL